MKQYKSLITGSIIAVMIIITPIATFAEGNNKIDNKQNNKTEEGNNKENIFNSIKDGFTNLFKNKIAKAEIKNNLAPTISGLTAPTFLKIGEVGTWSIKASDRNNEVLNYDVTWGDQVTTNTTKLAQTAFTQTSTFTHSYAEKGTYNITFTVKNSDGLTSVSKTTVQVAASLSKAPVISNLIVTTVNSESSIITWTTDIKSNSDVWYSTTSLIDTTIKANISKSFKVKNHKIELKNLEANTKYYIVAGSTKANEKTVSTEISFTTPVAEENNTKPVINSLVGLTSITEGQTETVTVNASDPQNGILGYTADWGDANILSKLLSVINEPVYIQSTTFTHVYNTPGTYTATFTAENSNGEKDSSSIKITVNPIVLNTTIPVISNIETKINSINVTISWITNEPSTSSIFYSTVTPVDMNNVTTASVVDAKLVTNHSLTINGLTSSTLYHFVTKSLDASNNIAISSESMFITN